MWMNGAIVRLGGLHTIVSAPCFELSDDDFESESNEFELACFDAELWSIVFNDFGLIHTCTTRSSRIRNLFTFNKSTKRNQNKTKNNKENLFSYIWVDNFAIVLNKLLSSLAINGLIFKAYSISIGRLCCQR